MMYSSNINHSYKKENIPNIISCEESLLQSCSKGPTVEVVITSSLQKPHHVTTLHGSSL